MSRTRLALLAIFIGGGLSVGLLMQAQHQQRAPVAFKRAFDRRCRGGCDSVSGGPTYVDGGHTVFLSVLPGDGGAWNMAAGTLVTSDGGATVTTRASSKFCTDFSGVMHQLTSNKACVDASGLNLEPATTNYETWSQQYNSVGGAWAVGGGGGGSAAVTTNTVDLTAPDGTSTAGKLVLGAASTPGSSFSVLATTMTTPAGSITISAYMRTLSGTASLYLARADTAADPWTLCNLTTTWARCTLTTTNTAASHGYQIGTNLINAGETAKPAMTVYLWGVQIEPGTIATSYIPTTGAVTSSRAADFVNVGPITLNARNVWSMSADVKLAVTQASNATAILFNMYRSSTDQTRCYLSTAQKFLCAFVDSGAGAGPTTAVNVAFAANVTHHVSSAYDGTTWTTCVDTSTCTTLSTSFNVGNVSETNFGLMSDGLSGVGATGWMSHICVDNASTGCL